MWGRGTSDRLLCGVEGPLIGYCVGERDTRFTANGTRSHATLFSLEETTAESVPRSVLYFN